MLGSLIVVYVLAPIPLLIALVIQSRENGRLKKEIALLKQQLAGQAAPQRENAPKVPSPVPADNTPVKAQAVQPAVPGDKRSAQADTASVRQKKTRTELNATSVLFFTGVFLISVGITVFAASTWKYQGLMTKSLVLLSFSLVGFISAWISGKKLKLIQTSVAAFSLGFVFIGGILFLAAGAEAFGGLFALEGRGLSFLLCAVFLLIIVYGCLAKLLYRYSWCRWMALAAYLFFLLFLVRFIDCGQNLFPFLLLLNMSVIILFYREQENRNIRTIAVLVAAGTGIIGFAASYISMSASAYASAFSAVFPIPWLTPSFILYFSAAGIVACAAVMSRRLPELTAVLPFSFLAFVYTFQNIYVAAAGIFIMTVSGGLAVWKIRDRLAVFKKTFIVTGPILVFLFMLMGSGELRWLFVLASFCLFIIFADYTVIDRNSDALSAAFVSLTGFVFCCCYTAVGEIRVWMGWIIVLCSGIGAVVFRRLGKADRAISYRIPEMRAMILGMACVLFCPEMGNIPLCLAAMAVLVYAVYPTRLQPFLALPLLRFCIILKDLLLTLPLEHEMKEYAVLIAVFTAFLLLSEIPDRGKGIFGMNCFTVGTLYPVVCVLLIHEKYSWTCFLVLLMLSMAAAAQIRKGQKKNYILFPLSAVLFMLAFWQQPFFDWPDFLYGKLPALIPLLTLLLFGKVFGRFRFFELGLCLCLMVFMAEAFIESMVWEKAAASGAMAVCNWIMLTVLAVLLMLRSEKHENIWYYAGFAWLMILGIHHAVRENGAVFAAVETCLALGASFIPEKNGKDRNMLLFSGAALVFAVLILRNRTKLHGFVSLGLITVIVFLLLRKRDSRFKRYIVAAGTLFLLLTVYVQPFFRWPDVIAAKLLFLVPTAVLLVTQKICRETSVQENTPADAILTGRLLSWSYILVITALFIEALVTGKLADAIITAAACFLVMIGGAVRKNRLLLYAGAAGVIIVVVYLTRGFWTSLPWWVYLIAAGTVAIGTAIVTELIKKKDKK